MQANITEQNPDIQQCNIHYAPHNEKEQVMPINIPREKPENKNILINDGRNDGIRWQGL